MKMLFAVLLKEHKHLGLVLLSTVLREQKYGWEFVEIVTSENISALGIQLTDKQRDVVNITSQMSEKSVSKIFSKSKTSTIFFHLLTKEFYSSHILPYIEKKNVATLIQLKNSDIPIFYKNENSKTITLDDKLQLFPELAETVFHFTKTGTETRYTLAIRYQGKEMSLLNQPGTVITHQPCFLLLRNEIYHFEDIDSKKLNPFFKTKEIVIPKRIEKNYYETFVLNCVEKYPVYANGFVINHLDYIPKASICLERNFENRFSVILSFQYGKMTFLPNNTKKVSCKIESKLTSKSPENYDFTFSRMERILGWEKIKEKELQKLGLKKINETHFQIPISETDSAEYQQAKMVEWLNQNIELLQQLDFDVIQNVPEQKFFIGKVLLDLKINKKIDWFEIHAKVRFGDIEIPFIQLKQNILEHKSQFILPNGQIAIIPEEWFARFEGLMLISKKIMGWQVRVDNQHFNVLSESQIAPDEINFESFRQLLNPENYQNIKSPENINATLRPYQLQGFAWLLALQNQSFGGCLADDMGLGKTLQTLALLVHSKNNVPAKVSEHQLVTYKTAVQTNLFETKSIQHVNSSLLTSLIVVPLSLLHNWANEIKKFCPHMKYVIYSGNKRNINDIRSQKYDVVLTSYGIVRKEIDELETIQFFYVILDESQSVKNPESKVYQAVMQLSSYYRLALSGTPIENTLSDLWAQFNFLNPNILGNQAFFKAEYEVPIEKQDNKLRQKRLQALIKPFILRRTKNEVEKDLPALTEEVIFCEMTEEQAHIYETEKSKIRNLLLKLKEDNELYKAPFFILQGMMKLRQLANHPQFVDNQYEYSSGKFDELSVFIKNLLDENHKVLIFSSFVRHLKLYATFFEQQNWNYSLLTGQTKNREEVIRNFQENADNHLFLISLKAGGYGLNLTSADYVIILDPWWNPASESQAISRAHRIGQNKKVFVYRFISAGSIEEKILILQEKKKLLADTIINSNKLFDVLKLENIVELFE